MEKTGFSQTPVAVNAEYMRRFAGRDNFCDVGNEGGTVKRVKNGRFVVEGHWRLGRREVRVNVADRNSSKCGVGNKSRVGERQLRCSCYRCHCA